MYRFHFFLCNILLIAECCLYAQLPAPVIDSVSVDPYTCEVNISWSQEKIEEVDFFTVNRLDYDATTTGRPVTISFDTLFSPFSELKSTDPSGQACKSSATYQINAYEPGTSTPVGFSRIVSTVFLTSAYDSCNARIELHWTAYESWENQLASYKVYTFPENNYIASTKDTFYIVDNISSEQLYTYIVKVENEDGRTSSSNSTTVNTDRPDPPGFINPLSIGSSDEQEIQMIFQIDKKSELNDYNVYRSETATMEVKLLLDSIKDKSGFEWSYTDQTDFMSDVYYYELAVIDGCNEEVLKSEIINTTILTTSNQAMNNELEWNKLHTPANGTVIYSVFRSNGDSDFRLLTETTKNSFHDNISNLAGKNYQDRFCYYISGKRNSDEAQSISNITCVSVIPEIFLPKHFTPNMDGKNDHFLPVFSFIPSDYHFIIYDHWGKTVFESDDPGTPWSPSPKDIFQGVYVYELEIRDQHGTNINKTGHVSVIIP